MQLPNFRQVTSIGSSQPNNLKQLSRRSAYGKITTKVDTVEQTCNVMSWPNIIVFNYRPLTRHVKLRVVHAPGMPGTFSRQRLQMKPIVSDPGMHHGTCVMHVPWCVAWSLIRGGRKSFPALAEHAQLQILRIWQDAMVKQHIHRMFLPKRLFQLGSLFSVVIILLQISHFSRWFVIHEDLTLAGLWMEIRNNSTWIDLVRYCKSYLMLLVTYFNVV